MSINYASMSHTLPTFFGNMKYNSTNTLNTRYTLKNEPGVAVVRPVALNILMSDTDRIFNRTAIPNTVKLLSVIYLFYTNHGY